MLNPKDGTHGSQCHHNPIPLVASSRKTTSVLSENLGIIRRSRIATSLTLRDHKRADAQPVGT